MVHWCTSLFTLSALTLSLILTHTGQSNRNKIPNFDKTLETEKSSLFQVNLAHFKSRKRDLITQIEK